METIGVESVVTPAQRDAAREKVSSGAKSKLRPTFMDDETAYLVEQVASEVMEECRKELMMRFRFFSAALWRMPHEIEPEVPPVATDGEKLYFEPLGAIYTYRREPARLVRTYLHSILHCIFRHPFETGSFSARAWSLACDILVESVALEMCEERFACEGDGTRRAAIENLAARLGGLAPKVLGRCIEESYEKAAEEQDGVWSMTRDDLLSPDELTLYEQLFTFDGHRRWAINYESLVDGQAEGDADEGTPDFSRTSEEQYQDVTNPQRDTSQDRNDDDEDGGAQEQDQEAPPQDAADEQGSGGDVQQGDDAAEAGQAAEQEPQPARESDTAEQDAVPEGGTSLPGAGQLSAISDEESREQAREEWEDIAKQVEMDLAAHADQWGKEAGKLSAVLQIANRKKYDYAEFLRKFCVMAEDMKVNDDEFDYIYYTYGLDVFGNMPLVEPLEYMECERVREFVIAIDTSGSCSGELVCKFIQRTYDILKESETFASEVNIHIVQCDARVQQDTKITNLRDLDKYLSDFRVYGLGGTDFRPVFEYVEVLRERGEFENLQGLVYFTDGQGTYPSKKPPYDAAFVFLSDTASRVRVPPWAMKVVMDEEDIREL